MSRIKQAIELLSQEAASLAPEVRQAVERLRREAGLLIQPVSQPLDGLPELLAALRAEATAAGEKVGQTLASAKDEAAGVIADLTALFESQGMDVNVKCFEQNAGETTEEFHTRVQREVAAFENSVFADEDGEVDLSTMTHAELTAYIAELDALLDEASDTLDLQTDAMHVMDAKLVAQAQLLDEANRKCSDVHAAASLALGAIHDFDIKLARELLEKVVK